VSRHRLLLVKKPKALPVTNVSPFACQSPKVPAGDANHQKIQSPKIDPSVALFPQDDGGRKIIARNDPPFRHYFLDLPQAIRKTVLPQFDGIL